MLSLHPSSQPLPDVYEGLGFRVDAIAPFGTPQRLMNALSFGLDGSRRADPGQPLVIVAPSLAPVAPMAPGERCRALLQSVREAREIVIEIVVPVILGGLSGCRALGSGVHRDGRPLVLYEVVLDLPEGFYLRFSAQAAAESRGDWIPIFDRMAATLRLVDGP